MESGLKLEPELYQYLCHIADNLKANRAAVLVGAGFSRNADSGSVSVPPFPTWNELADTFCAKLHFGEKESLRYLSPLALAEQVEATYGRAELDNLLMSKIPDTQYRPSVLHKKLLSLPWTDVFTTNYDTLLERACHEITEKRFNLIYCKEDLVGSGDAPRIIKLHGTFPSHRPFIITSEDYRRYPKDFAPFINTVQQSLLENTLCLIGFSGDDQNFNQWLGWIHDNLGPNNSPQIYLFTHKDYPDAQKRMLYRKRVVVLDISSFAPGGNPRQCYEPLLDWLIKNVQAAKPTWPEMVSFQDNSGKEKSLDEAARMLREIRTAYPGWLVPPHSVRERAIIVLRNAYRLFAPAETKCQKGELTFLYEYNWLREKCLRPLTEYELKRLKDILERYPFNMNDSKEDNHMKLLLYLSLLGDCRKEGNRTGWQELFEILNSRKETMTEEESHRLSYERCLFAKACFNYGELKKLLEEWKVDAGSPEWSLRKAGLLAECGFIAQAHELSQNSLMAIRRQLQTDDQNYRLLSLESALMSLKGYVEQAIRFEKKEWGVPRNQLDPEAERRMVHQKYELDWYREDDYFQLNLKRPAGVWKQNYSEPSFDFGRETTTFNYGQDEDIFNAFAFLMFREETGHPFRIFNVVSGNKTAGEAGIRISPYSFHLAAVTIASAGEESAIDKILPRAALSKMKAHETDELCRLYLDAIRRIEGELKPEDWFTPRNLAGYAAGVLPKLISHLCVKCTLPILDESLQVLLEIYRSKCRLNYKKVKELTNRLIASYTKEQLRERIAVFMKFPLIYEEDTKNYGFPDIFEFIPLSILPAGVNKNVLPGSEPLLEKAEQSTEIKTEGAAALRRLTTLMQMGLLTAEQRQRYIGLLWGNGIPQLEGFDQTICLHLPHPEDINPKEILRRELLAHMQDRVKKQEKSISFGGDVIVYEFNIASQHGVFSNEDIPFLLQFCLHEQKRLIHYLSSDILGADRIAKEQLYQLSMGLFFLLLQAERWEPSTIEWENIEELLGQFKSNQFSNPALEILWARKCGQKLNEKELLKSCILRGNHYDKLAVFEAVMLNFQDEIQILPPFVFEQDIYRDVFGLISQQIMWRHTNDIVSAISVMSGVIRRSPDLLTEEIKRNLLVGLECILDETVIASDDSLEAANEKGAIRTDAAELAKTMIDMYTTGEGEKDSKQLPLVLCHWEETYNNPDEFIEVRKAAYME